MKMLLFLEKELAILKSGWTYKFYNFLTKYEIYKQALYERHVKTFFQL